MKKAIFVTIIFFVGYFSAWADTYNHTIIASTWSTLGTQTLTNVDWTAAATWKTGSGYFGYDVTKGQQFGSSSNSATALSLTTSGIAGTITDIKITTSGAGGIAGTVSISVGGTAFTCNSATSTTLTSTNSTYDFTGSALGTVVISWSQTSSKALYVKAIEITYSTCNASNLAFANSSVTKMISDASFTQTATSLNATAPIVYSSSATGVATVNSSTGEVSVVGIGSTTISASQASANGYCPASASYSLTVTPLPTVTLTDITDITLNAIINHSVTQTMNINAVNLSTDLGLAITGPNADLFTLSQYTVTETGGNVLNTAITITYSPITVGNHTAILTMASTGAMNLTRTLNGISNQLSGINAIQLPLNVGVANGKILFTADSGESLDIYNGVGQKLLHQLTTEGLNTVSVHATGVLLVKLGNRVAKVIL
jgi:hypothetical protein